MPEERVVEFFVVDILVYIDKIKRYFNNSSFEKFAEDEKTFEAITRDFEIIGEALKYILNYPPYKVLINKKWREIIDFRNIISHHYFGINLREVYDIICEHFPVFANEFLIFTKKIKNTNLMVALSDAKIDAQKLNQLKKLEFLNTLEILLLTD